MKNLQEITSGIQNNQFKEKCFTVNRTRRPPSSICYSHYQFCCIKHYHLMTSNNLSHFHHTVKIREVIRNFWGRNDLMVVNSKYNSAFLSNMLEPRGLSVLCEVLTDSLLPLFHLIVLLKYLFC